LSHWLFLGAPFLIFYLALLSWLVLPSDFGLSLSEVRGGGRTPCNHSNFGIKCLWRDFLGWAANSKYPFLGSLGSAAQMISYAVSFSLIILTFSVIQFGSSFKSITGDS
jgi:NADH:ubiquinone oxidoreductase subunit H